MSDAPGVVRPDFLFSQIKNVNFETGGWLGVWADRFNFPQQDTSFTLPGISGGTSGFQLVPPPSHARVANNVPYVLTKADLTTKVAAGAGKGAIGFFIDVQDHGQEVGGFWMLNLASISQKPFQVLFTTNFIASGAIWLWKGTQIKAGVDVFLNNTTTPYKATPAAAVLKQVPPVTYTVDPKSLSLS